MKFTKFIPLVCALALTVPAFAATNADSNVYDLVVPEYFNITNEAMENTGATVTIGDDMSSLSYSPAYGVTYGVVNNKPGKVFYVKATAVGANTVKAFNSDCTVIAFANDTVKPTDAAIEEVLKASPAKASSANAIAFQFTRDAITPDEGVAPTVTPTAQELVYTAGPGSFHIPFTIGTNAVTNTFSSHDAAGTYKATITITDVATP